MKATRLKTENLYAPIGLGNREPRFSWNCEDGITQTAYRVVVTCDKEILWDSKKVASSQMSVCYGGKPLKSRLQAVWSVELWDENDCVGERVSSTFEIGIDQTEWTANWISGAYTAKRGVRYPVDCFRKLFSCNKGITRARLYATAKGVYQVKLNGKLLDDFILAPGVTDYRKRLQYQTYDVTELIRAKNNLEIFLGDGWWRGSCAAYSVENVFGTQTELLAQLELLTDDGSLYVIATDGTWDWCCDGPVRYSDLKEGEIYDAWLQPSYAKKAKVVKSTPVPIVASDNVPVKEHERLKPTVTKSKTGKTILDFSQNIAGYLEFNVKGKKGQQLKIRCGEVLDENGDVDLSGIQESKPRKGWSSILLIKKLLGAKLKDTVMTPKQEILFKCSGGDDFYKTSFAVFGFRYAEIETDVQIVPEKFTAIAVYSDMEITGLFSCSDQKINQLYQNTLWSMKGNFLDIPTDCPTRERLGWTGDAQLFFDTGAYLMDTSAFFKKWMRDLSDAQYQNGLLPAVVPVQGAEMMYKATGSSVGWADAVYLIPYRHYLRFGDKSVLEKHWRSIALYCDYLMTHTGFKDKKEARACPHNRFVYEKGIHLGEWLEPEEFRDSVYGTKAKHPEECTAYLYYAMSTIEKIANVLGKSFYAKKCREYAEGAKKAYNALFIGEEQFKTNRQAKLVRPLALGLLDGENKKRAQAQLKRAVEEYGYRIGTGFLSTPFLLSTLEEADMVDVAYRVLENPNVPGWLAEVNAGATTVWEDWEGKLSQNHYSLGSVVGWLFSSCAGIRIEGENKFKIIPQTGGNLHFAEAIYLSPYGKVVSCWTKHDGQITYNVEIPANTTAEVVIDGKTRVVQSGKYEFIQEKYNV